jgi:hypothetical protein
MPVAGHRHHAEVRVEREVGRRTGSNDKPPALGRRRLRPAPLEQRVPDALALPVGLHHQLRQLLHPLEQDITGVAHELAVELGERVATARLRGDELDERPLAQPVGTDVGIGQLPVTRHDTRTDRGVVHRALRESERGSQISGPALPESELLHSHGGRSLRVRVWRGDLAWA